MESLKTKTNCKRFKIVCDQWLKIKQPTYITCPNLEKLSINFLKNGCLGLPTTQVFKAADRLLQKRNLIIRYPNIIEKWLLSKSCIFHAHALHIHIYKKDRFWSQFKICLKFQMIEKCAPWFMKIHDQTSQLSLIVFWQN